MSERFQIHLGNSLDLLPTLPEASVDAVVTDPPYELGFMGKAWDGTGIANRVDLWAEVLRVLKPGGHLLAFSGTRTYHRMTCAIEDAGFEVRDQMAWVYGSGFPKSHNMEGEWEGWGTALKPAWEPICVARKPLRGTVAANVLAHGTGALNIDGCRVATDETLQGSTVRNDIRGGAFASGHKANPGDIPAFQQSNLGRWPANLIHDGSEEVARHFPAETGKSPTAPIIRGLRGDNVFGGQPNAEGTVGYGYGDTGSAARFFYCAKASKEDRDDGLEAFEVQRANIHPTVKPTDLMRYLCRLVTPPGGLVLDPFMGSGSTGKAAMLEGFRFAGVDMTADYVEIARARIAEAAARPLQGSLFAA
jgi:site-specific DNA-methyltransferase (adenine-specific)